MVSVVLQFYESIQDMGKYPQYEGIFLVLLFVLVMKKMI